MDKPRHWGPWKNVGGGGGPAGEGLDRKGEDANGFFPAVAEAFLTVSQFAAAGLFLVLAIVLLAVKFNSRVNRAFAIFLLLRGMTLLLAILAKLPANLDIQTSLVDTSRYFTLATPFVLLYFVVLYKSPQGGLSVRIAGLSAILLVLVFESLYALDHCLIKCPALPGYSGPLSPISQSIALAQGLVALTLALEARKQGPQLRARPVAIVASAFALLGILDGTQGVVVLVQDGGSAFEGWLFFARISLLVGFAASVAAVMALWKVLSRPHGQVLLGTSSAIVFVTTIIQLSLEDDPSSQAASWTTALFGTWRLLAAALVAYSLVRHRFLDLDLRINWTISRGTVLGVFIATFVIVSQIVENQLDQTLGVVVGGIATGVMLLALRPLERLGDKIAASLHPRGRVDKRHDEQVALFHEQAMMVWADGHIGRKERLLLDNLRERLGIDATEAARIEHQAALESGISSVPNSFSTQS